MPYVVVNREGSVLSRASPDALLSWIDLGVSRATDFRYAVLFETSSGAFKCAGIYDGRVMWVAAVGSRGNSAPGVGIGGVDCVAGLGG